VALPDDSRTSAPAWQHHAAMPTWSSAGVTSTVIMGEVDGASSPGVSHSPILGVDVALDPGADLRLPLEPDFEYAVLAMSGALEIEEMVLTPGTMLYLGCGRRDLRLGSEPGARVLLLGGEPFEEEIVMWWNFVARSGEEIAAARESWMDGTEFGPVADAGDRTPAPLLPPGTLKPGGRLRRRSG
jgi:hypothetical protein